MGHKIVYNACYGGFGLSEEAEARFAELAGRPAPKICYDFDRHDPILVQVVEELGDAASGFCACLRIAEIEGSLYRIDEYDGFESVETPDEVQWVQIP